jgi:hypothetical protein
MMGFALFVAVIFAGVNSEISTLQSRIIYGLKVFGSFIGIGLAIAWVLYFFHR